MSHNDRLTAFTAASPPLGDDITAASFTTTQRQPEIATQAITEARAAVAEYLRDLGLRDPDVIAAESHRIVVEAQGEEVSGSLIEAVLRLTVRRLERFLAVLASQAGAPGEAQRMTSGVAARLPTLLGEFPQAFNAKKVPADVASVLRAGVSPVLPPARPQPMHRQRLTLIPASLQKLADFVRGEREPR